MKIAVIGTGYVGLVAGACFAETGNDVTCADIDPVKIRRLNEGIVPIYEPGLAPLVEKNRGKRLFFTTDVGQAVSEAEVVFIAVGTPPGEGGEADLKYVLQVADTIGRSMAEEGPEQIIITKSTVPVGTAERVREAIGKHARRPFHVCSNPEFLKEGAAVDDFMNPDRVVVGVESAYARERLGELYAPFLKLSEEVVFMDVASAEITKYAANAMLATRISFMNAIATLCERVGADVTAVRAGIARDARIGEHFLHAGAGYGGSCFPKDVRALIRTFEDLRLDASILTGVEQVNTAQKQRLVTRVCEHYGEDLSGLTFAVWGLSFKPETDDMREAPALEVVRGLCARGARVVGHDPEARDEAGYLADLEALGRFTRCDDQYECLQDADALLVLTEWKAYRRPEWEKLGERLKEQVVFDGRNLWDPDHMRALGFTYVSVGRPPVLREVGAVAAAG